ncbi:Thioesterase/thiol ester dehydrase-isomerase [Gloeophyllum trabeum ATCC 11539]|uniref:Thioesterase/thiol ester dehydrase-isomerase n=1 Tax=Gloeophyllum trabeum (strain ATCC 11539 / FP-39264 / Madison 617) TaxID=670483 RepID=S7PVZ1_GLOTA|nr:Thioesterase/thiol ester dehydrase-isomerase [Gloeophyllum trabeum ATCC 11539]EPQ51683.1 Thioesterase/thiol ester dehydrase-isomerase [Gloeophyllum trabeum ATCC 11539]
MLSTALRRPLLARPLARRLSTSPPPPGSPRRFSALALSLFSLGCSSAYLLGALYPPPLLTLLAPRPGPAPPHPSSPEAAAHAAELEAALQALPPLAAARGAPDVGEWYETRPYTHVPEERRVNSLTAGALAGPGRLAVRPLVRARRDESESWVFVHVGRGVCGHEGIVHGGLLATLLDEGMGRVAIQNLPEKVGVTATLNITYRAPTRADQFIILKTKLDRQSGRKAWVSGRVEDANGKLLVEANAMFVQPKYAALLNKSAIRQVMGDPELDAQARPVVEGAVYPTQGRDEREA